METETAIRLWSIFGKYGLNLQHIHYTIILKQSGGAGIGGTPEKHGAQKVFFALIPVLFACCVPITRYRHFSFVVVLRQVIRLVEWKFYQMVPWFLCQSQQRHSSA